MDTHKADLLLQFIIAVAGQRDSGERKLGPIHLVKYAYLADLEHARKEGGKTFTGAKWTFHHFGPWATELWRRIDPALEMVNAEKETVSSPKYEGDIVRYSLEDDDILAELEKKLPIHIALSVKQAIREFSNDTASLLHHVYLTEPMLRAAPGESLDFSCIATSRFLGSAERGEQDKAPKKIRKEQIEELRAHIREKVRARKKTVRLVRPDPPVIYDDVFFDGMEALDSLAGDSIEEGEYSVEFSNSIWKSKARYDPDLS